MRQLPTQAPDVYDEFKKGKFAVRVQTGNFNGMWTDLALEQTFNKEAKTHLFKGITMNPDCLNKYLYILPLISTI